MSEDDGRQIRVALTVEYHLQGALAQFSRSSLAQELGRRLVAEFATNLNARFGGAMATRESHAPLSVGRLLRSWLVGRLRRVFGRR
jgi:carbon-monoxide dehydrogenase small subunit